MNINKNSDIADRLYSASFNGRRSITSLHLREASDEIKNLRERIGNLNIENLRLRAELNGMATRPISATLLERE